VNRSMTALTAATLLLLGSFVPAAAQGTATGQAAASVGQATAAAARGAAQSAATAAREVERAAMRTDVSQRSDFKSEQVDTKTQKLAIGSNGDISLRNVVGDMTVKAGGGGDATIEIIRTSRGRTDADARMGLDRVTVDVTVRGEHATVETRYPDDRHPNYAVSVSYVVTAPAGSGVALDTVSGHLSVTGLKGEVTAHAVSGKIELSNCAKVSSARAISGTIVLTNVQSAGDLEVEGISGTLQLNGVKARKVSASITSGTITASDMQADAATIGSISGDIAYSGSVASKGRYEFHAQSGSVKLGLTGGFDLQARTFSGRVEAETSLGIAKGTNARSLTGTAGNGGASVVATTFSGSVWIGRKIN
jgi:hypothetical protein